MNEKATGWIRKSPMHQARSHFAIAAYQGKIYVFGGGGSDFRSLNTTEIYDPGTDSWQRGSDMPTVRSGAVAAVLEDQIYVMGGGFKKPDGQFEFFRTVEVYDPEKDTWTTGPDMLMPHDYPSSAVLNGRIYMLGGHHPDATKGGPMTDPGFSFCEVFDAGTSTWQEISPMPTPRFAFSAVVLDHRIVALGGAGLRKEGFTNYDIAESLDPHTGRWNDAGFRLPWQAAGIGACVINETLYIAGGNSGKRIEGRFACLAPSHHRWTELIPLEEGRIVMGMTVLSDTIYIIGGRGPDGKKPVASVDAFHLKY